MIDNRLEALHDSLPAQLRQPSFEKLLVLATKRRRRNRVAVGVSGSLALACGLVVSTVWTGSISPSPPSEWDSSVFAAPARPAEHAYNTVYLTKDGIGWAVSPGCSNSGCSTVVAHARSRQLSWEAFRIPSEGNEGPRIDQIVGLGTDRAIAYGDGAMLTTDGGRSWTAIETVGGIPVSIAVATSGVYALVAGTCEPSPCDVRVARLEDGGPRFVPIPRQPTYAESSASLVAATDGSLWIAGLTTDRRPFVERSSDGGDTWATTLLAPTDALYAQLTTQDGTHAALLLHGTANFAASFRQLYSSADGGTDWRLTATAAGRQVPGDSMMTIGLASRGALVGLSDNHTVLFSSGEGANFRQVDGLPAVAVLVGAPGLVAGVTLDGRQVVASEDGINWRTTPISG